MAMTMSDERVTAGRRLAGKVAVITGGASGLGLASARRFAAEGARVACLDLDGAAAAAAAAEFDGLGVACDVSDEAAVAHAVDAVLERFGTVDVLYANAGIAGTGSVDAEDLASWNRMLAVHLTGAFLAARAVLAPMLGQGSGSIILQSSVAGVTGIRNLAAYTAAKGGIVALARQMAADYSERGVRVNAVCPGTVRTPLVEQTYLGYHGSADAAAAALAERDRDYPAGRLGAVEDIASFALFLAGDESRWITGGVFPVDGGATAVSMWRPAAA
jgi:NAD(P)-dependent dehydrogenase (short-subunit alcohol dehydrogenase family)